MPHCTYARPLTGRHLGQFRVVVGDEPRGDEGRHCAAPGPGIDQLTEEQAADEDEEGQLLATGPLI